MTIDELNSLSKEERFQTLREKRETLLSQKKEGIKFSDGLSAPVKQIKEGETKAASNKPDKPGCLSVTVACNTANFCDSYYDVLTDGAYTDSINTRGTSIPHIVDHTYSATSHVGDVQKVYTDSVNIKDLGFDAPGTTTTLLMDSIVKEAYNPQVYQMYLNNKVTQHSIGLSYEEIKLAMNSDNPEDKEEFSVWNQYYPSVINKDKVDKSGYFWVISKADIRENSAVLFGANPLTPTLSSTNDATKTEGLPKPISFTKLGDQKMTLEEAQAESLKLKGELAILNAETEARIKTAVKAEQDRILGIQKAAETLGLAKSAESFITKGLDVSSATTFLELVKEEVQKANPSPKGDNVAPTVGLDGTKAIEEKNPLIGAIAQLNEAQGNRSMGVR